MALIYSVWFLWSIKHGSCISDNPLSTHAVIISASRLQDTFVAISYKARLLFTNALNINTDKYEGF